MPELLAAASFPIPFTRILLRIAPWHPIDRLILARLQVCDLRRCVASIGVPAAAQGDALCGVAARRLLPLERPIRVLALRAHPWVGMVAGRLALCSGYIAFLVAVLHALFHEGTAKASLSALLAAEAMVTLAQGVRLDTVCSIAVRAAAQGEAKVPLQLATPACTASLVCCHPAVREAVPIRLAAKSLLIPLTRVQLRIAPLAPIYRHVLAGLHLDDLRHCVNALWLNCCLLASVDQHGARDQHARRQASPCQGATACPSALGGLFNKRRFFCICGWKWMITISR